MNAQEQVILKLLAKRGKLQRAYWKREKEIDAEIEAARKELGKACSHSETEAFRWEHDDGYGRQSMCNGLRCLICGRENRWPGIGSRSWY